MHQPAPIRIFTTERRDGRLSRRELLRIGGLAGAGCLTPSASRAHAAPTPQAAAGFGKARSAIFIYASGGQSQLETWDPKPDAPENVRGEFRAIATAVPGTFIGEHLPRVAALAGLYTIVRSLSHDDLDHGSAGYLALTGRPHPQKSSNPPPRPSDEPTYGAVLKRVRPIRSFPYEAVHLNAPALVPFEIGPGQDGGYLGRRFEPDSRRGRWPGKHCAHERSTIQADAQAKLQSRKNRRRRHQSPSTSAATSSGRPPLDNPSSRAAAGAKARGGPGSLRAAPPNTRSWHGRDGHE